MEEVIGRPDSITALEPRSNNSGRYLRRHPPTTLGGIDAAALMGLLRAAMRACAIDDDAPAGVLRRLVAYHAASRPEVFPMVAYVAVDLAERRLTVVSLGHAMPLLLRRGAIVPMPDVVEPPLGVDVPRRFREGHVDLKQHDLLVLFTDGVVERRDVPLEDDKS